MIAAASLVMSRNSWRENGAGMRHSVGVGAPDPWLLNTQTKRAQMRRKVKALNGYYLQIVFKNTTLFERLNSGVLTFYNYNIQRTFISVIVSFSQRLMIFDSF